jgi:hypothetical protein
MAHAHHHHDQSTYYLEQLFTIAVCGALGAVALTTFFSDVRYADPGGVVDVRQLSTWDHAKLIMLGSITDDSGREIQRACKLSLMLHSKFHFWVLLGSIAMLALVAIRAVALWFQVDQAHTPAGHSHDHGHDCCDHDHAHAACGHDHAGRHGHDHDHGSEAAVGVQGAVASLPLVAAAAPAPSHDHDHTHEDGHDHGWAPWRYVVLLLPVVLYMLNLPNQGFRGNHGLNIGSMANVEAPKEVADNGVAVVGFKQLEEAALTEDLRQHYDGKTVKLSGRYVDYSPTRFTLIRYKINCCAADALPVKALIMVHPGAASKGEKLDNDKLRNQWVEVTGRIAFLKQPGTNQYMTALILCPSKEQPLKDLVKLVPMDPNPWLT